jgi:hypothetical protein
MLALCEVNEWEGVNKTKNGGCFVSAKFGQMRAFLKLQIICDNLKRGGMHDKREKVQDFA